MKCFAVALFAAAVSAAGLQETLALALTGKKEVTHTTTTRLEPIGVASAKVDKNSPLLISWQRKLNSPEKQVWQELVTLITKLTLAPRFHRTDSTLSLLLESLISLTGKEILRFSTLSVLRSSLLPSTRSTVSPWLLKFRSSTSTPKLRMHWALTSLSSSTLPLRLWKTNLLSKMVLLKHNQLKES